MADTVNLYAESGRNIIGDDTTPTLDLSNTSTGSALQTTAGSGGHSIVAKTSTSNTTIAPIRVEASAASGSFFHFVGAVISTASINISAAQTAGVIRVYLQGTGGNAVGYMPIFKGVV